MKTINKIIAGLVIITTLFIGYTLFEGNKSQETIVSNVTESQGSLEYAERKPPKGDVSYDIERVREYAEKAGKTIEEIGTTEEEITELLNAGYVAEAQQWLEFARNPAKGDVSYDIERVREYAEKAGKTIEEIGTTEEEITELLNAGYIAEAQEWLEYARGK